MSTWQNSKSDGEKTNFNAAGFYNPLLKRLGAVDDIAAFKGAPYSYIVFKSGSTSYAMSGTTGDCTTIAPSTDATTLIQNALTALS